MRNHLAENEMSLGNATEEQNPQRAEMPARTNALSPLRTNGERP